MQPSEGKLHLRLHARHAHYLAPRRALCQVVQQRGLAYVWVAAYQQHPAFPSPDSVNEPVEHVAFATPVDQRWYTALPTGLCGHRPAATPRP